MADYIFLMHNDTPPAKPDAAGNPDTQWDEYLKKLQTKGCFRGGSAIGQGMCARKEGPAPGLTSHIGGFIRVEAASLEDARKLLHGNPVFESGGTVEIRELPRDD